MAEKTINIVDNWEEIDENEIFNEVPKTASSRTMYQQGPIMLQGEDAIRSQYMPPEPFVKILKRPSKQERQNLGNADLSNGVNKHNKSLRQREAEYAEARQRIMGNSEEEINERLGRLETAGPSMCPERSPSPPSYTLLRPSNERIEPNVIRLPRGPDGGPGFTLRR